MRPIIILTIVGLLSASLLAVVDDITREPIAKAKALMERRAIEEVFPFPLDSLRTVTQGETSFFEARDTEGQLKGIARVRPGHEAHRAVAPDCQPDGGV